MTMSGKTGEHEQELVKRQESLRGSYARFREMGHTLSQHNVVGFKQGQYYMHWYGGHLQVVAKNFLKLQCNIINQAMLLLELRHAIDMEEKK
jgi:hypothetical protein